MTTKPALCTQTVDKRRGSRKTSFLQEMRLMVLISFFQGVRQSMRKWCQAIYEENNFKRVSYEERLLQLFEREAYAVRGAIAWH